MEREGQLIAFFYFSDDEDAAGYVSLRRAGDTAANAGLLWAGLLRSKWERGLKPSEATAEIEAGETVGWGSAYLVPGSLTEKAAFYRALKEKAKSL